MPQTFDKKTILLAQHAEEQTGVAAEAAHPGVEHGHEAGGNPLTHHSPWDFTISGAIVAVALVALAVVLTRRLAKVPGSKLQALAEVTVEGLNGFARTTIGPGGERFTPLVGTLFLFILFSNLAGLLPLVFKPDTEGVSTYLVGPMANISMTFALAIVVFLVVQYTAIRSQGLKGRLQHLAGPVWWLSWLMLPLELIGELVRPLSLSVRLFGNIFGEETILAVLIALIATTLPWWFPLPLHFPILLFGLVTALVQAGVFTLLSCVYLSLALEDHSAHGAAHDEHDGAHGTAVAAH